MITGAHGPQQDMGTTPSESTRSVASRMSVLLEFKDVAKSWKLKADRVMYLS